MEKLKMSSPDLVSANIEKIASLFPNVVTEAKDETGVLRKVINFDKLKQELSSDLIEGEESYDFTWVGKKASMVEASTPIQKTLRPCIEVSKNWEKTENLYVEGDNLEVLKLLQESYLGKVKMIYIDPPYNTGNDFIYKDDFKQSKAEYEDDAGIFDDDGNRLFQNTESNGRFHSDWCGMIFSRLKLARNLLREDGFVFVSIDDNEVHNLRKICDEVFGEANFVASIIWQKIHSTKNDARYLSDDHEYVLLYSKNKETCEIQLLPRTEEMNNRYLNQDNDPRGPWASGDLVANEERKDGYYEVVSPSSGKKFNVPKGKHWVYSKENMFKYIDEGRIWFGKDGNSFPRLKRYLAEVQQGKKADTLWLCQEVGHNQEAKRETNAIFDGNSFFSTPKPIRLILQILKISSSKNSNSSQDIILDFFSGSATTAHAVMQLNAEDGGNRKFIMVQLPEACDEKSEAFKAGYKNICEIGKERIRRAGEKIKAELAAKTEGTLDFSESGTVKPDDLDIGFRVFKVDSSNMKDVYYAAGDYTQNQLDLFASNIKEDRTPLDLLYQCMLDWGVELSLPHSMETIDGVTVHTVDNGALVACFDDKVPESVVREIAKRKPLRVVFRDSSFADSQGKINVTEIFKTLSGETSVRVI